MTYRNDIINWLEQQSHKRPSPQKNGTNLDGELANVMFWETVADIAADKAKEAWISLASNKFILDDDSIRASVSGEALAAKGRAFGVKVKVDKPRAIFNREAFITSIAEKFKVAKHKVQEIAKSSTSESKPPLTKKIIEL